MELNIYVQHIEKTIESLSEKVKKTLFKYLEDDEIILKNSKSGSSVLLESDKESMEILGNDLEEQLSFCYRNSMKAVMNYEKWEFLKDYKYSVLFQCEDFDKILAIVSQLQPLNNLCENEYVYNNIFKNPVVYHTKEFHFLKFNLIFSAVHPTTQEELLLKYPFLVVFHRNDCLIEFRFDGIKRLFYSDRNRANFFDDLVNLMRSYFMREYNCELLPLDLEFLISVSKSDSEAKLTGQFMELAKGGSAQLDVGKNQDYMLPFVGELKAIMIDNRHELDKVPILSEALKQFMYEIEELSDYAWIVLKWENEVKIRSIEAKFIFNYHNRGYCLIQHFYNNVLVGMERMNNVVKYIVNHRNDDLQDDNK